VGVIEWIHDPVLDRRSGPVVAEFVAKGLGIVAAFSRHRACIQTRQPNTAGCKKPVPTRIGYMFYHLL
jgi:hypothetical protein